MELFLLTEATDYEGETTLGLYSSMSKALVAAEKVKAGILVDEVNIYEIEVDYEYEYDPPCLWSKRLKDGKVIIGHGFETKKEQL
jgi:hypothetical protein